MSDNVYVLLQLLAQIEQPSSSCVQYVRHVEECVHDMLSDHCEGPMPTVRLRSEIRLGQTARASLRGGSRIDAEGC